MSTKLVKQQIKALISEGPLGAGQSGAAKKGKEKFKEKRRQAALKKKVKALAAQAQAQRTAKLTAKKNLRYFKSTKGPSELNAELMGKLLASAKK
ncbi:hypothetical protein TSOC_015086 [Tetrabaena socialis]|uniref:Uncharacterized protein n=1 Tax=Tetrabaena socialis TaxID=47790 RepID=A0A2J7ZFU1_9CHLO|nr:hypothetical protein TSOC_015086 [Tetrabaena socialis]|eukprot:PNG99142.1 hypothetical protein TSOC_015086 [Tetrabaena socialis]